MITRRNFIRSMAGSAVLLGSQSLLPKLVFAQGDPRFDLVIQGGRVVDPSQKISAVRDIGIKGGAISEIGANLSKSAARVLDATGKIVTPGLIDTHVHIYDGVGFISIPADDAGVAKGSTVVIDAGSAGATTFPAFRRLIASNARTRVYSLLNISLIGLANPMEVPDMSYIDVKACAETIEKNRDIILGVKVRMTAEIVGHKDLEVLKLARQAADKAKVPMVLHLAQCFSPVKEIFALMRPGDVVTHTFREKNGILGEDGKVLPEARDLIARGVYLDIGHGGAHFSFDSAERILNQGIMPDTISTDLHTKIATIGPVFDLETTLSKFLCLGMSLDQVIERVTVNPARIYQFGETLGTLKPGAPADVAVFDLKEGDFEFVDSSNKTRRGKQRLMPYRSVRGGQVYEETKKG
jgi:dihydroorotase